MKKYVVDDVEITDAETILSESRDELLNMYWIYHPRFRFFKCLPSDSTILDVGAGSGGLQFWREWNLPVRKDLKMYAIDLNKGEFFARYVDYQICNLDKEPIKYPDNFFDIVFASHVLEHIHDESAFLKEVCRVLKYGGKLYIEIPMPSTMSFPKRELFINQGINVSTTNFYDDATHIKTYSPDELKELLQRVDCKVCEYGIIENKFIDDMLFTYGMKKNDQELITYSIWSKLRWAHYIIGEKVLI